MLSKDIVIALLRVSQGSRLKGQRFLGQFKDFDLLQSYRPSSRMIFEIPRAKLTHELITSPSKGVDGEGAY